MHNFCIDFTKARQVSHLILLAEQVSYLLLQGNMLYHHKYQTLERFYINLLIP